MNDEFFDWLEKCPTEWRLTDTEEETREYIFYNNDEEIEEEDG